MSTSTDAADASPATSFDNTPTITPVEQQPDLLDDLTRVWGNSVGLDPDSAMAIILTVAGGIAGNSVRINAPMIGELGPDLQLAVMRDPVPALCRGLQRLLAQFEGSILEKLQEYEHLSSERAQRHELSSMEALLNLSLIRDRELEKVTSDDNAMMNLAMQRQEVQVLAEHEEIKKQIVVLRSNIRALRFRMRPMVMVSQLGIEEIESIAPHAYDSAVLEIVSAPGHLGRLALMRERHLERLAAFRRNSGYSSRLEYYNGEYRQRSAVTTVLLAGADELIEAGTDSLLRLTGIINDVLVCRPKPHEFTPCTLPDPGERWAELVNRLFSRRLDLSHKMFNFDVEARSEFRDVRQGMMAHGGEPQDGRIALMWREIGPATVAKLALCIRLFREEEGTTITVQDVRTAARVAWHLLETTTAHMRDVAALVAKRRRDRDVRRPKKETEKENPVARMVGKLKKLAPCSMRTLFRNYSSQNYTVLQPVLERAIELNLVYWNGKLLQVAGSAADTVNAIAATCQVN